MLDIYLVHDPDNWDGRIREGERATGERLYLEEWEAIFFIVLMGYCPMYEYYVEGQEPNERQELYRRRFQGAIPEYPMLCRMWDMYVDAIYQPKEISQYREECLRVQAMTNNSDALSGLGKLVRFCDEAEKHSLGLYLACD